MYLISEFRGAFIVIDRRSVNIGAVHFDVSFNYTIFFQSYLKMATFSLLLSIYKKSYQNFGNIAILPKF